MNSLNNADYLTIAKHYEACFAREGDSHKGVDWPNAQDAKLRYKIMSELFRHEQELELLDIGCGLGHYFAYLKSHETSQKIHYKGLDISEKFVQHCQEKYPDTLFFQHDVLTSPLPFQTDFAVMNGVFTVKNTLPYPDMFKFLTDMLKAVFSQCRVGMAFNVMSKNVDWERDDLFHVSIDAITAFLSKEVSRHILIRHDYGLYEYTIYVYRKPLGAS